MPAKRRGGGRNLNVKDTAILFGVSAQTVQVWISQGCPIVQKGNHGDETLLNSAEVLIWREELAARKAVPADTSDLDLNVEKARLAKEQADRAAMENAVRRRELLPADEVLHTWAREVAACRARLLSIPSAAAPVLATLETQTDIEEHLTQRIHEALRELADGLPSGVDGDAEDGEEDVDAASPPDGEPVGGPLPEAESGSFGGAGAVADQ